MDDMIKHIQKKTPWCMLFADDVMLCDKEVEKMERELECWRRALEDKGLKLKRNKTVQLNFLNKERSIILDLEKLSRVEKFK